jgi:hypothetical protein
MCLYLVRVSFWRETQVCVSTIVLVILAGGFTSLLLQHGGLAGGEGGAGTGGHYQGHGQALA